MSCLSLRNCFVKIGFISFCIIPFRFVSVNFVSIYFASHRFRFVSVNFVSFRWSSFRLVWFRFVSVYIVSQFTGTRLLCGVLINLSIDDCDLSVLLLSLFVILTVFWGSDLLACCLLFPFDVLDTGNASGLDCVVALVFSTRGCLELLNLYTTSSHGSWMWGWHCQHNFQNTTDIRIQVFCLQVPMSHKDEWVLPCLM